jgi:hypothetical protein
MRIFFRCTESNFIFYDNNNLNRSLHAVEISWSYLAPALLTGIMDARVFLKHPPGIVKITEAANREHTVIK